MDPITLIIFVTLGGILIGGGVHFIPVGGAPAAMATATGVGTGTAMLAIGAGLTGLITSAVMTTQPVYVIMFAGAVGAMMTIGITMLFSNIVYVFGVGTVPSSAKIEVDPITGKKQKNYVTPGTEGHGVPTICYISGLIGASLGGIGGGLIYYGFNRAMLEGSFVTDPTIDAALAAIFAVGVFTVNAVIASYNIGGTIEGFHDPKFKKIGSGIIASASASLVMGVFAFFIVGGAV